MGNEQSQTNQELLVKVYKYIKVKVSSSNTTHEHIKQQIQQVHPGFLVEILNTEEANINNSHTEVNKKEE